MSNCCATSASVFSPLTAAKATFALKAGVWFRRGRLDMVLLLIRGHLRRCQADIPLITLFRFAEPPLSSLRKYELRLCVSFVRQRRDLFHGVSFLGLEESATRQPGTSPRILV